MLLPTCCELEARLSAIASRRRRGDAASLLPAPSSLHPVFDALRKTTAADSALLRWAPPEAAARLQATRAAATAVLPWHGVGVGDGPRFEALRRRLSLGLAPGGCEVRMTMLGRQAPRRLNSLDASQHNALIGRATFTAKHDLAPVPAGYSTSATPKLRTSPWSARASGYRSHVHGLVLIHLP